MYLDFSELDAGLLAQYRHAFDDAFPDVIFQSEVVNRCWKKVEQYFPEFQRILIGRNENLIGFMNTLPIHLDRSLEDLPDEGWDWLMQKGISDFEQGLRPNCLGGLQVVVSKENLAKGYSKLLIAEGKRIQEEMEYPNFIIPIRPIFKHRHPNIAMLDYIQLRKDGKLYDPWIRTHVQAGAKIISVCTNSMNIQAPLTYWEKLVGKKITKTGYFEVEGALNPVRLDVERNLGEYREENIWINHR